MGTNLHLWRTDPYLDILEGVTFLISSIDDIDYAINYKTCHQHFGSDVTPVRSNDRAGVEPLWTRADTPRRKNGTSADFMWHHCLSTNEIPYTPLITTKPI